MNPTKKQLQLISVIIILTAFCALLWFMVQKKQGSETVEADIPNNPGTGNNQAAVQVEVGTARIGDLVKRLSATGLTRAVHELEVSTRVGGMIVSLPVQEGDFVRKGDVLMKFDDREYVLALAEARDKLLGAQAEFGLLLPGGKPKEEILQASDSNADDVNIRIKKRPSRLDTHNAGATGNGVVTDSTTSQNGPEVFKKLRKKFENGENLVGGGLFNKNLEAATREIFSGAKRREVLAHKSGLTEAFLALQRAELNLSYTKITAPFSGNIADLEIEQGQQVNAGEMCCKLLDLSRIKVEVQALESDVSLIAVGRKASVTFPAFPGENFHGVITRINPMVDTKTKTMQVTVLLENPERRILPGMFAYANLEAQIFKDRLLVPKAAILIRDQRKLLFIVRDGLAKWCYVETGLENEKYVEILSSTFDLKPGELVITSGHYTLVHDARVRF